MAAIKNSWHGTSRSLGHLFRRQRAQQLIFFGRPRRVQPGRSCAAFLMRLAHFLPVRLTQFAPGVRTTQGFNDVWRTLLSTPGSGDLGSPLRVSRFGHRFLLCFFRPILLEVFRPELRRPLIVRRNAERLTPLPNRGRAYAPPMTDGLICFLADGFRQPLVYDQRRPAARSLPSTERPRKPPITLAHDLDFTPDFALHRTLR